MVIINAKLADRAVSAIAASAFLQELFDVAQRAQAGSAVFCAVVAMCFVPGVLHADPAVELKEKAWYVVVGKAIWAAFTYGMFQEMLDEWQHERLGGTIVTALFTAFFLLSYYYGSGRWGPWDLWLTKRRIAKTLRESAQRREREGSGSSNIV
jgi:hypothetical protein